jgi:hypothetical protein
MTVRKINEIIESDALDESELHEFSSFLKSEMEKDKEYFE